MAEAKQFTSKQITVIEATIVSSGTDSTPINVYGATLAAIEFPATMTSTSITLQGSIDDGDTFKDIYTKNGGQAIYTIAGDRTLAFDPIVTYAFDQIKIIAGSSEGAERTLKAKAFSI